MSFFETQLGATKFFGPAALPLSSSSFGTHLSHHGIGGFSELPNVQHRNAIPIAEEMNADGVSSGRRKIGMVVYTIEENKFFQLVPLSSDGINKGEIPYSIWSNATDAQKMVWLDPMSVREDIFGTSPTFELLSGTNDVNDCWREVFFNPSLPSVGTFLPLSGGTVTGDLIVDGSFTVNGSATFVNSENLVIEDPLIFIAQNNPANLVDMGIVGQFINSPTQFTGLVRDHQLNEWILFSGLTGIELTATDIDFTDPVLKIDTLRANLIGDILSSTRVFGTLSASGDVYGNNLHWLEWDSTWTTVSANSAVWGQNVTDLQLLSSNWQSTYTTVSANSATWSQNVTDLQTLSGNWQSTYTTVSANSATWSQNVTDLRALSGNWQSTYTTVSANSAIWGQNVTDLRALSGNWQSTYTTVTANSATWTNLRSLSGNWQSTYTTVSANSATWSQTSTDLRALSGRWQSTFTTVSANSATWSQTSTDLRALSGRWQSTFTTVSANSASWGQNISDLQALSGNWQSTYTTVSANSATWSQNVTDLQTLSGNWQSTYTSVKDLSSNWESTYTTVSANSARWESAFYSISSTIFQEGNSFGKSVVIGSNDPYSLVFETSGIPRMTILSGGNVGIGTTNPNHSLTVIGDISANAIRLTSSTANTLGIQFGTDTNLYRPGANRLKTDDTFECNLPSNTTSNTVLVQAASNNAVNARTVSPTLWSVGDTVAGLSAVWNSTTTTVSANSAIWGENVTDLRSLSGNWQSTYTTVSANSSTWVRNVTDLQTLSGNWQSTYTTVNNNSATWVQNVTDLQTLSGNWQSTYLSVKDLSSNWESTYTTVSANSARWETAFYATSSTIFQKGNSFGEAVVIGSNDPYSLVFETSGTPRMTILSGGNVGIGTTNPNHSLTVIGDVSANAIRLTSSTAATLGIQFGTDTNLYRPGANRLKTDDVFECSLPVNTTSNTVLVQAASNNAVNARTVSPTLWSVGDTVAGLSAIWNSTYTTVSSNSAVWGQSVTDLRFLSGNWQSTYTTVLSNSATWVQNVFDLQALSGNWQSTYTTVNNNSATWVQNVTDLQTLSGNWQSTYTTVEANSSDWGLAFASLGNYLPLSGGTVNGDLFVNGNLVITGSSALISSTNIAIKDSLIYLGYDNPSDSLDIGFVGSFTEGPIGYQHTGLVRLYDTNEWALFSGLTSEPFSATSISRTDPTFSINTLNANLKGNILSSTNVFGSLSSNNLLYDVAGNSSLWNSTYTTVRSNSASWGRGVTDLNSLSSNWQSTYTTVLANSASWTNLRALSGNWQSTYTTMTANSATWTNLRALSANWQSTFTTVSANSATWGQGVTDLQTLSGNWQSTYTTVSANSAIWGQSVTDLQALSGNWQSTFTTVSANSATWSQGVTDLRALSGNWQSTYTTMTANSATWTNLRALSGNWQSTYTTVLANSASWTNLRALSGNWQSTYTTVLANSASWTNLRALSGNWQSTFTTVSANSATWSQGVTDLRALSANWQSTFTTVSANSAAWNAADEILVAQVFNADSVTLNRGDVVYSFGATGSVMSVKLASNASEATSSKTLGFINETIIPNGIGYATVAGRMDKLAFPLPFVDGDALWLGSTPGTFTRIKPTAPEHGVYLGVVERANNGNGIAYVKVQNGYELDEIHDVLITSVSAGQILRRNSSNNLWINVDDGFNWDSVYTTVSSNSAKWETAYGASLSAILQKGNSFGENVVIGSNDRYSLVFETSGTPRVTILSGGNVGIGNSNPNYSLTVSGDISANALRLTSGTSSANGILFGADVNLYRSAANILKTDDSFLPFLSSNGTSSNTVVVAQTTANQVLQRREINPAVWNTTARLITAEALNNFNKNYIPKAATNSSLDNSEIYQENSNIGIGTTAPNEKVTVVGSVSASDYVFSRTKLSFLTDSFTIQLSHQNNLVLCNNTAPISALVPNDSNVMFDVGASVNIASLGEKVYVDGYAGVTINAADNRNYLRTTNSTATILKIGANNWLLFGDIWNDTLGN